MCFTDLVEDQEVDRSSEDDDKDGVSDGSKCKQDELKHDNEVYRDTTRTSIPTPREQNGVEDGNTGHYTN